MLVQLVYLLPQACAMLPCTERYASMRTERFHAHAALLAAQAAYTPKPLGGPSATPPTTKLASTFDAQTGARTPCFLLARAFPLSSQCCAPSMLRSAMHARAAQLDEATIHLHTHTRVAAPQHGCVSLSIFL